MFSAFNDFFANIVSNLNIPAIQKDTQIYKIPVLS